MRVRLLTYLSQSIVALLVCSCYRVREPELDGESPYTNIAWGRAYPSPTLPTRAPPTAYSLAPSRVQPYPRDSGRRLSFDSSTIRLDSGSFDAENDFGIYDEDASPFDARDTDSRPVEWDCPFSCSSSEDDAGLAPETDPYLRPDSSIGWATGDESAREIVRQHASEIRCCYLRDLDRISYQRDSMSVDVSISKVGVVESVVIRSSSLDDEYTESCIVSTVRCWSFPPAENDQGVTVNIRFYFEVGRSTQ